MHLAHRIEPERIHLPPMTGPQMEILTIDEQPDRCWDVEGAPRSAKSWGIGFWIWKLAYQYPGIQVFYCRYKDEGLIQLRDVWSKVGAYFPAGLHAAWNSQDQAYDFPNGSRVFLSSLKVSEAADQAAVHGKYKGKTIAVVIIEEAQEVPRVNYIGLKERLSQSKTPQGENYPYPLKIVLVHNAVDADHWIAQEFPLAADDDTCTKPGHKHIRADLYSNQHNLGPDVMAGYAFDYPIGNPLRRTQIEGKRGVTSYGTPVYAHAFRRPFHVSHSVGFTAYYPLLEGWDFGEEKPAVVWMQYIRHMAAIRVLGAVKGSELFLELFAPKVLEMRRRLFPMAREVRSWCDPTGATGNGGLQYTPIGLLHDLGITAKACRASEGSADGNDAEVRYKAIQTLAGYMLKVATDGSQAFQMAPLCFELKREGSELVEQESPILTVAFEAGYIWDTHAPSESKPNIRKPKKGTRYDDLMNAVEYCVIGEQIPIAPNLAALKMATAAYQTAPEREALQAQMAAARELKLQQREYEPADRGVRMRSRRGML